MYVEISRKKEKKSHVYNNEIITNLQHENVNQTVAIMQACVHQCAFVLCPN